MPSRLQLLRGTETQVRGRDGAGPSPAGNLEEVLQAQTALIRQLRQEVEAQGANLQAFKEQNQVRHRFDWVF